MRRLSFVLPLVFAPAVLLLFATCTGMKSSRPLGDLHELQRMIAGRLDASYVGNRTCLSGCHYHDKLAREFEATTMGAVMAAEQGVVQIDCESCHGPGSLAIQGVTPDKVRTDAAVGVQTSCKFETLINLKSLPVAARDLVCVNCHSTLASFNLHSYPDSAHARAEVPCVGCHATHAGPFLIITFREQSQQCITCHPEKRAELSLRSHHPVGEKKMTCNDCHDPHTANDGGLIEPTVEATCTRCHSERAGPFAFEHADVVRDCGECHSAHGSINDHLLKQSEPLLCLRCHSGHWVETQSGPTTPQLRGTLFTRCTDCHTSVHGTDAPSTTGRGTLTR